MNTKFLLILTISTLTILNFNTYSQKIGFVDDELLNEFRKDFRQHSKEYIAKIAKQKKLSLVVYKSGIVWPELKESYIDLTYEVLQYLKKHEKELPTTIGGASELNQLPAIEEAINSLRVLKSATEVGISYYLYSEKVVEVKANVDQQIPKIFSSKIIYEINLSMEAFVDAREVWGLFNETYPFELLAITRFSNKYNLGLPSKTEYNPSADIFRISHIETYKGPSISKIWTVAVDHFNNLLNDFDKLKIY